MLSISWSVISSMLLPHPVIYMTDQNILSAFVTWTVALYTPSQTDSIHEWLNKSRGYLIPLAISLRASHFLPSSISNNYYRRMVRFSKLALGAAFVGALTVIPSSIVGNVGKFSFCLFWWKDIFTKLLQWQCEKISNQPHLYHHCPLLLYSICISSWDDWCRKGSRGSSYEDSWTGNDGIGGTLHTTWR